MRGTKLCPNLLWYEVQAALYLMQYGNESASKELLLQAADILEPNDDDAGFLFDNMLKIEAYQETYDHLVAYFNRHPTRHEAIRLLIRCALELEDSSALEYALLEGLREDEERIGILPSDIRARLSDRALDSNSGTIIYYAALACAHNADNDTAVSHLRRAVNLSPSNPRIHYMLGRLLFVEDRYSAIEHVEKAVELEPENANYNTLLGLYHIEEDEIDRGIALIQEYSPKCKDKSLSELATENLMIAYRNAGRTDDFEQLVQKAKATEQHIDLHILGIVDAPSPDSRIEEEFEEKGQRYKGVASAVKILFPESSISSICLINSSQNPNDFEAVCLVVFSLTPRELEEDESGESLFKQWTSILKKRSGLADVKTQVTHIDDIWTEAEAGRYKCIEAISNSRRLYDHGFAAIMAVLWNYRQRALLEFQERLVSYVVGGSFKRRTGNQDSDVDIWLVIDDSDIDDADRQDYVKDTYRRALEILTLSKVEIQECSSRPFHLQLFGLTQLWTSLRQGHPIVASFLADGAPIYHKGLFSPWKAMVRNGYCVSTMELIRRYEDNGLTALMNFRTQVTGDLREKVVEPLVDFGRAILMSLGFPAPAPGELGRALFEVKETHFKGVLSKEDCNYIEALCDFRTRLKATEPRQLDGELVDQLMSTSQAALDIFCKLLAETDTRSDLLVADSNA